MTNWLYGKANKELENCVLVDAEKFYTNKKIQLFWAFALVSITYPE
jgi:hypothetical protein